MEGFEMAILGHDDFLIDNSLTTLDPFWISFNNRIISVIYLFHATFFV